MHTNYEIIQHIQLLYNGIACGIIITKKSYRNTESVSQNNTHTIDHFMDKHYMNQNKLGSREINELLVNINAQVAHNKLQLDLPSMRL